MPSTLKNKRYKLELWIDKTGEVEDEAFAYPVLTRPKSGALPAQEVSIPVGYKPSSALRALLKAEHRAAVDAELIK